MLRLYQLVFWLPALVSAITLRVLWSEGALSRPVLALGWFGIALALQLLGGRFSSMLWASGLVLQTSLALYALIQRRLGV